MAVTIGIDPGLTGALAILGSAGELIALEDLRWKKDLQLAGKDKKAALHKARLLYPTADLILAKHHGRAEALLLGYWWMQHGAAHRAAA